MSNWIFVKDNDPERYDTDSAIEALIQSLPGLIEIWKKYIHETYKDYAKDRLDFVDISVISRHIIDLIIKEQTIELDKFFDVVEAILNKCNDDLENLMVVGLIESLQNNCGTEINYYTGFDSWLKPKTKVSWDELIYMWEGDDAIENYKAGNPDDNRLIRSMHT